MQALANKGALVDFETLKDKLQNAKTESGGRCLTEMDIKALFETLAEVKVQMVIVPD